MKMDEAYIKNELRAYPYTIEVQDCVTSTNSILKDKAKSGATEYSVLMASMQTEGRGRMGRSFFSPCGSGLYMSVLLSPDIGNPLTITTDAAVCTARAIEKLSGKKAGIKWVNDIYLDDRKVCGILAESSLGKNSYVILGIGVNVFMPKDGFPDDIRLRAGSVFSDYKPHLREKLAINILKELFDKSDEKTILDEYKKRSIIAGKEISIIKNNSTQNAVAIEINDDYSLKVKTEDGSIENINSGDVSIKIK